MGRLLVFVSYAGGLLLAIVIVIAILAVVGIDAFESIADPPV